MSKGVAAQNEHPVSRFDRLAGLKSKGDYFVPGQYQVFLQSGDDLDSIRIELLHKYQLLDEEAFRHNIIPQESIITWGTFRGAVALCERMKGLPEIAINGERIEEYFSKAPPRGKEFLARLMGMDEVRAVLAVSTCTVRVRGSSAETLQQIKAVTHALANVVSVGNPGLRQRLEQAGFGGRHVRLHEVD